MSEPVQIARFIDIRQAEFARSVLEGSGIEAFIDHPFMSTIAPHLMMVTGVGLFVASEDKHRALDVLRAVEDQPATGNADDEDPGSE